MCDTTVESKHDSILKYESWNNLVVKQPAYNSKKKHEQNYPACKELKQALEQVDRSQMSVDSLVKSCNSDTHCANLKKNMQSGSKLSSYSAFENLIYSYK